jgi:hypothetical protein
LAHWAHWLTIAAAAVLSVVVETQAAEETILWPITNTNPITFKSNPKTQASNVNSMLIVGYHHSKISFHFCKKVHIIL